MPEAGPDTSTNGLSIVSGVGLQVWSDILVAVQDVEPSVGVRLIRGSRAAGVAETFDEFAAALQWPPYFSYNWDSFGSLLKDIDCTDLSGAVVLILDAERLLTADMRSFQVLLRCLQSAARFYTEPYQESSSYVRPPFPYRVLLQSADPEAVADRCSRAGFDVLHRSLSELGLASGVATGNEEPRGDAA